mgnify:FL=1
MFKKIIITALFAGFIVGVVSALLQLIYVQPILLHAELYETGSLTHFGENNSQGAHYNSAFDFQRNGLSILFSALIYTGYALILVSLIAYASSLNLKIDNVRSILFGVCGFFAVQLAPAFGLPPELPGAAAAELFPRQIWWFFCVLVTILGIWIVSFSQKIPYVLIGIIIILVPHIVGAPEPEFFVGPTPPELASHFASRTLALGAASWVLLGYLSGYFWRKENS